jgi:transcriptional regulator with XRE-family HTH domain
MTRQDLIQSQEYWIVKIQTDLFNQVRLYLEENKITQTQFAEKIGVSQGYISQIMNGNFNHSISKLIEISLAIGRVPILNFENVEQFQQNDNIQESKPSAI